MGMGSIIIIVLVLLVVIAGLVYFFVEIEEEEDEQLDGTSEAKHGSEEEEDDTYAWAKEAGIREQPEVETSSPASRLQKHDDHPGWLWDLDNEEWVPDPDHSDA